LTGPFCIFFSPLKINGGKGTESIPDSTGPTDHRPPGRSSPARRIITGRTDHHRPSGSLPAERIITSPAVI
jgi:hypothetical protein